MSSYLYLNVRSIKGKVYIFMVALLALVAAGILVMKNTMRYDDTGGTMLNILLAMVAIQLVLLVYNGFLKKIAVTPEGLCFQSPLSTYVIPWTAMRSMGAYKSTKNAIEPIPFSDLDKPIIFGSAWIYCSTLPHENVIYRNQKNTTIVFPYRKAILDEIGRQVDAGKLIR